MYKYCLYTMDFSKQYLHGASSLVLSFPSRASNVLLSCTCFSILPRRVLAFLAANLHSISMHQSLEGTPRFVVIGSPIALARLKLSR